MADNPKHLADLARLRERHVEFEQGFNERNMELCTSQLMPDFVMMPPGRATINGKAEFVAALSRQEELIPGASGRHMEEVQVDDLQILAPNFAFSRLQWQLVNRDQAATVPPIKVRSLVIWQKVDGDWFVLRSMDNTE